MLTKYASEKTDVELSDKFCYVCWFAGYVSSFLISLVFTDILTAVFCAMCLGDIFGFVIIIAGAYITTSLSNRK